jgi:hypothetical protein
MTSHVGPPIAHLDLEQRSEPALLIPRGPTDPDVAKIAQISGPYRLTRLTCINWPMRHCDSSAPTDAGAHAGPRISLTMNQGARPVDRC